MNTFGKLGARRSVRATDWPWAWSSTAAARVPAEADIQPYLDRRRPGKSPLESARMEPDRVEILSGVFEGRTTGAPIALLVRNQDVRSEDYDTLRDLFRPGHADYTWQAKYGLRDHRGGGRSSGRETLARVAAGAVALRCLAPYGISIRGRVIEIHGATEPEAMEAEIRAALKAGDSVGGIVEVIASGCPAGLGDPVFGKLDAAIAGAMMGIGAVKGVEIGEGFGAARLLGRMNDPIVRMDFKQPRGVSGGIGTGRILSCGLPSNRRHRYVRFSGPSIPPGGSGRSRSEEGTTPVSPRGSCRSRNA